MAKAITKGDAYELRLARLLYFEGSFVRRAIDLNMRFGEDLTVTDLDILALHFSGDFGVSLTIGESKTAQGKKGPKLADRLLWLSGLRDLVDADDAFVATAKGVGDRVRGLAERLDIRVIDEKDLAHREHINGIAADSPWGPYDPRLLDRQREVYNSIKKDQDLKRVYWFVRSEFWLLDVTTAVKRAFGAMRVLAKSWRSRPSEKGQESLLWLARQLQANIVVGLVRLASQCYREDPSKSSNRLLRELAAGPNLDYETLVRFSQNVDRFVTAVLRDTDADPGKHVDALGAFNPTPPPYSEPLIEVVERLAAEPVVATELPRFVDRKIAEIELGEDFGEFGIPHDLAPECDRLLRLLGAFIGGQLKIPPDLLDGVLVTRQKNLTPTDSGPASMEDAPNGAGEAAQGHTAKLFDESTEPLETQ